MNRPTLSRMVLCAAFGLFLSSCGEKAGVVKPEQQPASAANKATQAGTEGSLAGTGCAAASECGPGLDCNLTKGATRGVCVERVNPGSTPQNSQK